MPHPEFRPLSRNKPTDHVIGDESLFLKKQLGDMEGEVMDIQMKLATIRKDRLDLHNRKFFKEGNETIKKQNNKGLIESFGSYSEERSPRYSDVPKLNVHDIDLLRSKNTTEDVRFQRSKYDEKLKTLEYKLNNIYSTETKTEEKEQRNVFDNDESEVKTQLRDMKEEIEELKLVVNEKTEQLQEYRAKYLQAEQQAEELRRQLDAQDYDNKQVSDQIQFEIQKMKLQFQEKIQELAPLPDLLKGSQMQLQEAKQLQRLAEDSCQQLSNELHRVKEKLVFAVNNLNQEKQDSKQLFEDKMILTASLDERQGQLQELEKQAEENKSKLLRFEEKLNQQELRFQEKGKECAQLVKDLHELRDESSRALGRSKERTDSMRRYLQTQISELERQLIQSRAQSKACHKERDDLRQRMQVQLSNLQENFEMVEIRLRSLQNQVTSLKNSYTIVLADDGESDFNIVTS